MVTHSGASLHRGWYFPLRSPISFPLRSHTHTHTHTHTQHLVSPRTVYLCLSHKKKTEKKKNPAARTSQRSFPLFAIFFCLFFFFLLEWWKLGQETAGEVRLSVTCRRRRLSEPRGRTSGRRRSCQSSAHRKSEAPESARGDRCVNEGNFNKLGLAEMETVTETHEQAVRESNNQSNSETRLKWLSCWFSLDIKVCDKCAFKSVVNFAGAPWTMDQTSI